MEIPYTVEVRPDTGLSNGKLGVWLFLASVLQVRGRSSVRSRRRQAGHSRHMTWWPCRFDKHGKTTFITAFYAVPTGVGRCRLLLRCARWLQFCPFNPPCSSGL